MPAAKFSTAVHSARRAAIYDKERQSQHPPEGVRVGDESRPGNEVDFPPIVHTTLRPDIVIWSEQAKKAILVELTVPWEESCDKAHERKKLKCQDLVQECREKGWQTWLLPVEVGCRGFPVQSVWAAFTALWVSGREWKTAVCRMGEAAERASCWFWFKKEEEV